MLASVCSQRNLNCFAFLASSINAVLILSVGVTAKRLATMPDAIPANHIAQSCQCPGLRVGEGILDDVKGGEAHAIFAYGADDYGGAAFV